MILKKVIKKIILITLILNSFILLMNTVFAAGQCAFSAGAKFSDIDTREAVEYARIMYSDAGYFSYYSTNPNYNLLGGTFSNGIKRLESDVIFLDGHANTNVIVFPKCGLKVGGKDGSFYWGTDNFNWRKVRLVILAGCRTAAYGDSIAYRLNWGGATTSVGFRDSASTTSFTAWTKNFNKGLAAGLSVSNAKKYANLFIYDDSRIKQAEIIGNQNLVIKTTKKMDENNFHKLEKIKYLNISQKIALDTSNEKEMINTIINELKKSNILINLNNYSYEINQTERDSDNYVIDLKYKIGNFETDSGYTAIIEKGELLLLVDNTITNDISYDKNEFQHIDKNIEENFRNKAISDIKTKLGKNITIKDIQTKLYYDMHSGKKYIIFIINNEYKDGISVDVCQYAI